MSDEGPVAVALPASSVDVGAAVGVDLDHSRIVVWRTAAGRVCAMDSRCPHQWSDLGTEGVVEGDELVCTAHGWRFDCDGHGSKVNVNGRRDPKADIAVHEVREVDGDIEVRLGSTA